jgi:hypothetical protein
MLRSQPPNTWRKAVLLADTYAAVVILGALFASLMPPA